MTYSLRILDRAQVDVRRIFEWLNEKSPAGSKRWYAAFEAAVLRLRENPFLWPLAPEDEFVNYEIHHCVFRTRRGRPYRILYTVVDREIRILHVRSHGQDLMPDVGPPDDSRG